MDQKEFVIEFVKLHAEYINLATEADKSDTLAIITDYHKRLRDICEQNKITSLTDGFYLANFLLELMDKRRMGTIEILVDTWKSLIG